MTRWAVALVVAVLGLAAVPVVVLLVVVPTVCQAQAQTGSGVGTGDGSVPLPAVDPAAPLHVNVVSWNTLQSNSVAHVAGGLASIAAAGGEVVGMQERNHAGDYRALQARARGWSFTSASNKVPIGWRSDTYTAVAQGDVKVFDAHRIENGPGGTSISAKHISWVELEDSNTHARFVVVNDHKIAAVETAGHARGDNPVRVRLWHAQDAAVGRLIARLSPLGVPVFKTGDENVAAHPGGSPFGYDTVMQGRGMYSNWRVLGYPGEGTHEGGSRLIDYVWSTTLRAAPTQQRILGAYHSDHRALMVTEDNRPGHTTAAPAPTAPVAAIGSVPAAGSTATTTTSTTVTAGERSVWVALRSAGFDPVHAAAVMGNMKDESGFDPQVVQGGAHSSRPAAAGGGGYGLVQWTPGRKLADYLGSATPTVQNEVATLKAQLAGQGPHPETAAGTAFWAATDTATAARVFHLRYERSASTDSTHRVSNALDIERRLTGIAGSSAGGVPCPASGTAQSSGGGPVPSSFDRQGNPRTVEQAIAWMQANTPHGAPGEPVRGACERYMNLAYGLGGGYPMALAHWNAPGPKSSGYTTPPRGALVFWRTGNPAGHVALSLGNGTVISTDYNATTHRWQGGMLSAGPITDLDRWGPRLGWRAPNFRAGSEAA